MACAPRHAIWTFSWEQPFSQNLVPYSFVRWPGDTGTHIRGVKPSLCLMGGENIPQFYICTPARLWIIHHCLILRMLYCTFLHSLPQQLATMEGRSTYLGMTYWPICYIHVVSSNTSAIPATPYYSHYLCVRLHVHAL